MLISSDGFQGHTSKEHALTILLPLYASYFIILCAVNRGIHSPCIGYTKAECQKHLYIEIFQ